MLSLYKKQILPVINPDTAQTIAYKARNTVHKEGYWHPTVQAYILRKNPAGLVEVLVQKRSPYVDISTCKFDQSLAAHILKGELSVVETLKRSLKQELGVELERLRYKRILDDFHLAITKTYKEHPEIFNREILHLFLIEYNENKIKIKRNKIDELMWISWIDLEKWQKLSPDMFTKTARFYMIDKLVRNEVTNAIDDFFSASGSVKKKEELFDRKKKKIRYYSGTQADHDISVYEGPGFEDDSIKAYDITNSCKEIKLFSDSDLIKKINTDLYISGKYKDL